jgi:hypothetical protein
MRVSHFTSIERPAALAKYPHRLDDHGAVDGVVDEHLSVGQEPALEPADPDTVAGGQDQGSGLAGRPFGVDAQGPASPVRLTTSGRPR